MRLKQMGCSPSLMRSLAQRSVPTGSTRLLTELLPGHVRECHVQTNAYPLLGATILLTIAEPREIALQ